MLLDHFTKETHTMGKKKNELCQQANRCLFLCGAMLSSLKFLSLPSDLQVVSHCPPLSPPLIVLPPLFHPPPLHLTLLHLDRK